MQRYYKSKSEESIGLLYVEDGIGYYDAFLLSTKLHQRQIVNHPTPGGTWKEISGDQYAEEMIDLMTDSVTPTIVFKGKELVFS